MTFKYRYQKLLVTTVLEEKQASQTIQKTEESLAQLQAELCDLEQLMSRNIELDMGLSSVEFGIWARNQESFRSSQADLANEQERLREALESDRKQLTQIVKRRKSYEQIRKRQQALWQKNRRISERKRLDQLANHANLAEV